MLDFTPMLIRVRRKHPIFRRKRFFQGQRIDAWDSVPDISWLQPSGEAMTSEDWQVGYAKTLTVVLNGEALDERDQYGQRLTDSSFALFFSASELAATCRVPGRGTRARGGSRSSTLPSGRRRSARASSGLDVAGAGPAVAGGTAEDELTRSGAAVAR